MYVLCRVVALERKRGRGRDGREGGKCVCVCGWVGGWRGVIKARAEQIYEMQMGRVDDKGTPLSTLPAVASRGARSNETGQA